ncbi:TPA: DUF551 domain-containing protein [Klebsiella pneumoniae]|nr:DUF551 domain-containing protein [Klebsiella pneumoniae]
MQDPTSPYGWAAVSNNPLSIKAHVDLYSGKPPAPEAYDTDWESCRERAARAGVVPSVGIRLVSIARRTAGLLRQLDFEPNAESENPIEVLLFDAEKVESDIKEMKKKRAAMLAAAPQSPGSEPATVPGKWIPVSERMPETDGNYWGWWSESKRQGPAWFIKSELQAQFQSSEITHWMQLPAAPQEVKGE